MTTQPTDKPLIASDGLTDSYMSEGEALAAYGNLKPPNTISEKDAEAQQADIRAIMARTRCTYGEAVNIRVERLKGRSNFSQQLFDAAAKK